MLAYLPEKIYETIKNNEEFAEFIASSGNKIFGDEHISFVKSFLLYDDDNLNIQDIQKKSYEIIDKKYHKILDILFNSNYVYNEEELKNESLETQMLALYETYNGDMCLTEEFLERIKKFIQLYKQLTDTEEVSDFIHIIYYSFILIQEIFKMREDLTFTQEEVQNWLNLEEKEFAETMKKIHLMDSAKNILYDKRCQMLIYFFEMSGQFMTNNIGLIPIIESKLENQDFKYNNFNWFKILFYQLSFEICLDYCEYEMALQYFQKIYSLIIFSFQNKKYAMKALNHFNKAFLDEYLGYLRYFYVMLERFIPNMIKDFVQQIKILEKEDIDFIINDMDIKTRQNIYEKINMDTPYTIQWCQCNKNKFIILNEMLKNA